MKGDFTRSTHRPGKHYSGVLMQQGRVQLDADWNEAVDIATHRTESETLDSIGRSGGSLAAAGFALVTDVADLPASQQDAATKLTPLVPGDFIISAGRYYVDGVLCENDEPVTYQQQPDAPADLLQPGVGTYFAYLDVWSHHVTALEDADIREVALGGPDTATRTKTVWQVKLVAVGAGATVSIDDVRAAALDRSSGRMSARAMPEATRSDPCLIEPGAGYGRMENQLYRVEIHDKGALGNATFKWSRDNGSIAFAVQLVSQAGSELTLTRVGSDRSTGFDENDCFELTDDTHEISGEPGQLLTLIKAEGQTLVLKPRNVSETVDFARYPSRPKLRKWNGFATVAARSSNDGYLELEGGVEVKFESGNYASGDYWQVPARTATRSVEWPFSEPQSPRGIVHRYGELALLQFDGNQFTSIRDRRHLFPALTELTSLFYLGGDGQEAGPGQLVPQPLRVGVANGRSPVANASVRFTVINGEGTLQGSSGPVIVTTDAMGVASCTWTLGTRITNQQVEATLLDVEGNVRHLPVRFSASFTADTRDAGIHIEQIRIVGGGALENDGDLPVLAFTKGIELVCDATVDTRSVNRATCVVTVEVPFPANNADQTLWGTALLGYQPVVLDAAIVVKQNIIQWVPTPLVSAWLEKDLLGYLKRNQLPARALVRLTLHGHFIWQSGKPDIVLDGDAFGIPLAATESQTRLRLPSGDGRRGGDLRMWLWVIENPQASISITPKVATVMANSTLELTVALTGSADTSIELSVNGVVNGGPVVGTLKKSGPTTWTYTAPQVAPPNNPVTITAKNVVNPAQVATASVTIAPLVS